MIGFQPDSLFDASHAMSPLTNLPSDPEPMDSSPLINLNSDSELVDMSSDSETEFAPTPPSNKRKRKAKRSTRGLQSLLESERSESEPVETVLLDLDKTADLEQLLSIEARERELEHLVESHAANTQSKQYYAPGSTTADMVEQIVSQNDMQTLFTNYMHFVPQSADHQPQWTQYAAVLALNRVTKAVSAIPDMETGLARLEVIRRGLYWEIARSHLVLYAWYKETGPALARTLLGIHESQGIEGLKKSHPAFADLVDHIVQYVTSVAHAQREKKNAKRRKLDSKARARKGLKLSTSSASSPPLTPLADLRKLPSDLHGLRTTGAVKSCRLPEIK